MNELKPLPFGGLEVEIARCGDDCDAWWEIYTKDEKSDLRLFCESEKFPKDESGEEEKRRLIEAWNRRMQNGKSTGITRVQES